jgi:ubiquinone/menaquinone biosynthesis C-methylase UbiE
MPDFTPDMSSLPREANPSQIALNYATTAKFKLARFALYGPEFAYPYVDIEAEIVRRLRLAGKLTDEEKIGDLGASDGRFARRLREDFGHKGPIRSIEPHRGQLDSNPEMLAWYLDNAKSGDTKYLIGQANHIPLEDEWADILTLLFMYYHVPLSRQESGILECLRVLADNGVLVLSTSERTNKLVHREIEAEAAEIYGQDFNTMLEAAAFMNEGFDSDRAKLFLPEYFSENVYQYSQRSKMIITKANADQYVDSIISLLNQCTPPLVEKDEIDHMRRIVTQIVNSRLEYGPIIDRIARDAFFCSVGKLVVPGLVNIANVAT